MLYAPTRSSIVRLCLRALITALPLLIAQTATLFAQPAESLSTAVIPTMGINDVTEGTLLFKTNQQGRYTAAPVLKTDVQIAVTGLIARATVRQEFTNPSQKKGDWLEGIYVFPLPETAAVDHLRMHVGDRIIEGQIKERSEAKKVYEKAKQEGKRTSLVEQERPNIFTTSVANIGPGERIVVEIEYQETIRYDQGTFQLRFPMAVGQRYIPGTPVIVEGQDQNGSGTMLDTDRVPDASRITPPVQAPSQGSINPISLSLSLTPGFPVAKVESLFHQVIVIPDPDGGYHVSLKKDAVPADRDFQLTWSPTPSAEPAATVLTEQRNGKTYAMLMLMPPTLQNDATPFMPRDLTFVIDTSGSMAGPSIEQAKSALATALTRLTTQDRFNVIQFNNTVRSLFSAPQPVTTAAMRKAIRYVEGLSADGGTEILPALRQALKSPQDSTRRQQIVLMTDGQVGNEDELFELLHHRLGTRRLFTIGIGSTPNSHLMRKTAEFGRGTFTYVGHVDEVKNKLDALFKKLERPVLNDIQLDRTGWTDLEPYPSTMTDLYEGEPIVLALKATSLPDQAILRGQMGTQPWSLPISMKQATNRGGLSVYWARQEISALMDEAFTGTAEETVRKGVLDIALAHHLVSKYTSLVAVDITPARPINKPETELPQGTKSSEGMEKTAMIGLPKTGTNGQLQLLLGLLLLTAAAILRRKRSMLA
ncbi:MAG: marine proteobacterial sortase target protein [Nitrospira sp.]|nr:MAG: marine proteobacterial sortase target protein [Nitrospira sp.]